MASEYTEQDRANEGCCWNYVRQLCRGGGCLCDCHATTEQVLLSARATLRRQNGELEADNGRLLGEIQRLTALLAERDAEVARLVALLDEMRQTWDTLDDIDVFIDPERAGEWHAARNRMDYLVSDHRAALAALAARGGEGQG